MKSMFAASAITARFAGPARPCPSSNVRRQFHIVSNARRAKSSSSSIPSQKSSVPGKGSPAEKGHSGCEYDFDDSVVIESSKSMPQQPSTRQAQAEVRSYAPHRNTNPLRDYTNGNNGNKPSESSTESVSVDRFPYARRLYHTMGMYCQPAGGIISVPTTPEALKTPAALKTTQKAESTSSPAPSVPGSEELDLDQSLPKDPFAAMMSAFESEGKKTQAKKNGGQEFAQAADALKQAVKQRDS